jgi:hypothetical protein
MHTANALTMIFLMFVTILLTTFSLMDGNTSLGSFMFVLLLVQQVLFVVYIKKFILKKEDM